MMKLTCNVINALQGKTLSVAESCTGGMIGGALTAVPGSSKVFLGGVISYTNEIKMKLLSVPGELLDREGAVSGAVAKAMAAGVRNSTGSDYGISVTGLAGPGGDDFGNPVGTVYIGFADASGSDFVKYQFSGDRDAVREQAVEKAFLLLLQKM